jgi:hypothetical protein
MVACCMVRGLMLSRVSAAATTTAVRGRCASFAAEVGWNDSRDPRSTSERGYGSTHIKARASAARHHSPTDLCARCSHPLGTMGPHLHYDHNGNRTGYLGFSHGSEPCPTCGLRCNLVAGAQEGRARQSKPTLRW